MRLTTRTKRLLLFSIIFGVIFIVVFSFWPLYVEYGYICENTGSRKEYNTLFCGLRFNYRYKESILERFIKNQHTDIFQNRWVRYNGTQINIFGKAIGWGHGRPSDILTLINVHQHNIFDEYTEVLNDQEKYKLYKELSSRNMSKEKAINIVEWWVANIHKSKER